MMRDLTDSASPDDALTVVESWHAEVEQDD
jgi:hypothetical protein